MKWLLFLLVFCGPVLAREKVYTHTATGLVFPDHLTFNKLGLTLERDRHENLGNGHISVPYNAERLTITAYVYPPDASLEEDFTTCQHILSTSILSQQNLVEQGPLKLDHWPKTQQATYRCSGLTAYAKYTQLVMFELPKKHRLKLRISCDKDPRPISQAFLNAIRSKQELTEIWQDLTRKCHIPGGNSRTVTVTGIVVT